MSGPKSYSPPPRFSAEVFDGKLERIARMQSRIARQLAELEQCEVVDEARGIRIDCQSFVEATAGTREQALATVSLGFTGSVGMAERNRIDSNLDRSIASLERYQKRLQEEKQRFLDGRTDYNEYVVYDRLYGLCEKNVSEQQISAKAALDSIDDSSQEHLKENVESAQLKSAKRDFSLGFREKAEELKAALKKETDSAVGRLVDAQVTVSDKLISSAEGSYESIASELVVNFKSSEQRQREEVNAEATAVEELIATVDDSTEAEAYREHLKKILATEPEKCVMMCQDLATKITRSERTKSLRREIAEKLSDLGRQEIHGSIKEKEAMAREQVGDLLNRQNLRDFEAESLIDTLDTLAAKNQDAHEGEAVAAAERACLKEAIVSQLKAKGYSVLEDMKMERPGVESSTVFNMGGQSNYMNLRIEDDGRIMYNFLVDEKPSSQHEAMQVLNEMETSCEKFKTVMASVQEELGIEMTVHRQDECAEEHITVLRGALRDRVQKAKAEAAGDKTLEQEKQRYMDRE